MPRNDAYDWLSDEEEAEREAAQGVPVDRSYVERMEHLADHGTGVIQFNAIKWLAENKHKVEQEVQRGHLGEGDLLLALDIAELTDAELDKELAGFFNPGWVEPPREISREVEVGRRKAIRKWAKQQGAFVRLDEAPPEQEEPTPEVGELDPESEAAKARRAAAQRIVREQRARQAAREANGG